MAQEVKNVEGVKFCLVCDETGVEIRYVSEDPAQVERTHRILAYLAIPMESLKTALARGFAETEQ
jgi:hypothetical protein